MEPCVSVEAVVAPQVVGLRLTAKLLADVRLWLLLMLLLPLLLLLLLLLLLPLLLLLLLHLQPPLLTAISPRAATTIE